MAIDAKKIFSDSFESLNKNSEKTDIPLSSPLNPVFVFYLSKASASLHDELCADLKNVWGNSVDAIGFFLVEADGEAYSLSGIDGQELSETGFIEKASEVIEQFGEGYSTVHSYMFAETSNMTPEEFECLFKAGKEISEKLKNSSSMLITILDENIGKEDNANNIKRKLKELRAFSYNGTAVISNRCNNNSIIQVTPRKQEVFRDFNLFADIILLSNSKLMDSDGQTVSPSSFYDPNGFFTVSYKNKSRPDKERTAAVILGALDTFEKQIAARKSSSNDKTENWKRIGEEIKDHLVDYIYSTLVGLFPKNDEFRFIPLVTRPKKKFANTLLGEPYHVVDSSNGKSTNVYYEMNYAAEIDNYLKNSLREEDIRLKVIEILSKHSFIDIARHFRPSDIDSWTPYSNSQDTVVLKYFELEAKNMILEGIKPMLKKVILKEIQNAQNYINYCDRMISDLKDAINNSTKIINIDGSIRTFYGDKAISETLRKQDAYFNSFFSFVDNEGELESRFTKFITDVAQFVYDADRDTFDADFTEEIRIRNPGTHEAQINSQINEELTQNFADNMALKVNMAGRHDLVYKLFMLNDSSLKTCISNATTGTGFSLAFLDSGNNRFVEFVAVYSCDYEALIGG